MRIYVAGPMTHLPEFNFPAFDEATALLRERGHEVFSPAENDRKKQGLDTTGMKGDPAELVGWYFDKRRALSDDLEFITTSADAVVVLPGWESSPGARAEVAAALALGLFVVPLDVALRDEWPEEALITSLSTEVLPPGSLRLPPGWKVWSSGDELSLLPSASAVLRDEASALLDAVQATQEHIAGLLSEAVDRLLKELKPTVYKITTGGSIQPMENPYQAGAAR